MDNTHFPEQESDKPLEPVTSVPTPEIQEEEPVIQELSFEAPPEPVSLPEGEPDAPDPRPSEEAEGAFPAEPESPDQPEETIILSLFDEEESFPTEPPLDAPISSPPEPNPDLLSDKDMGSTAPLDGEGTVFPVEEMPQETTVLSSAPSEEQPKSFMDRIPDVEADAPPQPQVLQEAAVADSTANDPRNLPSPELTQTELDILQDPAFQPVPSQNEPVEDTTDQEYADVPPVSPAPGDGKPTPPRPTWKGRPKRKKGEGLFGLPNILVTGVWMVLILAIGVTLGRMLWLCAADVLAFGRPDQKVTITVYESDTMDTIVNKLYDGGLIRYKGLFQFYADISDAEEDIKPGIYDLNTRYDYHALVKSMAPSSTRSVVEVTIPEGYTCRQIFALLEENRVCTKVDIASYAATGELHDYWFLENVERGSEYCLEGFLFPDTYQFYKNSSPREALEKMLNNFDNRFTEEMRAQIDSLNENVTGGGYGVREVVIVASLIEKESAAASESPMIASVIYNRLHNWEYPALLNIDAAIIYAQGGDARTIDTSIDSPYNTYRYTGLTPTPIANPGLSSIQAALNPESTNYYFYVLNPATGRHQFSTTQQEHDAWIAQFYNNG